MKKRVIIITAVLCVASIAIGAVATGIIREIKAEVRPDFTIIIDGEKQAFKNVNGEAVEPILYNGTTYLPIRAVGELMNKKVYWYEDEKIIEFRDSETTVTDADVVVASGSNNTETDTKYIGEDKAKEIVLEKAGLSAGEVRFDRVDLDNDRGIWHYEIEFIHGHKEYSADVNAVDGTVSDYEVDLYD